MKKLIGALALAAMVATSAFAEISFGGWVRTLPTYVGSDGEDIKTAALSASWGGPFWARWDASWTSDDGKAGLKFKLAAEKGGVGTHDDVGIWLKPIDQLKIEIGGLDNFGGLRSDLGFGSWNWLRPSTIVVEDEGITFGRGENGQGLGLLITPTDALKIAVVTPLENTLQRGDIGFGKASVAAGYTIDGLGTIKAGFFGEYNAEGDASKYGRIEGAFDLTGVDKLNLTVGVAYRLASSDYWKTADKTKVIDNYMLKAALAASYGITEAFKVSANFAMLMFNKDVLDDPAMQFGVGADYALSDSLNITADVRMLMPNNKKDAQLSFLVGLASPIGSNASLGIGFQGEVGFGKDTFNTSSLKVVDATANDKFIWAVPLKAELSF
ncbi:MAG: hypothetical protein J6X95_02570 [Treponema sp.]|nr:hypothetical protein [Treponema sp.]